MPEIHIASRVRDNLHSLQGTQGLLDKTNSRLSTGLKVQTAVDDPVAFFKSVSLSDRAEIFEGRKDEIIQGIDALKTTTHALSTLVKFVKSIKGQISALRGAESSNQFTAYKNTFTDMLVQYNHIAKDAQYNGQSYVSTSKATLNIKFSGDPTHLLEIKSKNELASRIGLTGGNRAGLTSSIDTIVGKASYDVANNTVDKVSDLDRAVDGLDKILATLKSDTIEFGGKLSVLNIRSEFTTNYITDLSNGSDDLVLADTQKEGANMLALQTRQALALNSLSLAASQDANVLQLIRGS